MVSWYFYDNILWQQSQEIFCGQKYYGINKLVLSFCLSTSENVFPMGPSIVTLQHWSCHMANWMTLFYVFQKSRHLVNFHLSYFNTNTSEQNQRTCDIHNLGHNNLTMKNVTIYWNWYQSTLWVSWVHMQNFSSVTALSSELWGIHYLRLTKQKSKLK